MSSPAGWQPLLTGPLREQALAAARDIVLEEAAAPRHGDCSLEGDAGEALLFSFAGNAGLLDGDDELRDRLDAALDAVETCSLPHLWGGTAGTAWVVAHCVDADSAGELLAPFADSMMTQLAVDCWTGQFDLMSGLVGFGSTALELLPHVPAAYVIAERVLHHLEAIAVKDELGIAILTPPELLPDWERRSAPEGAFNCGVAHGVPGVIALLARFVAAGVEVERARVLLDGLARWLLARIGPDVRGRFPATLLPDGTQRERGRIGWCYGDLGVAAALVAAGRATRSARYATEGLAIARDVANRPFERSGVKDMAICHGAAGVAHLLHRLARATGDRLLAERARGWFARLLAMRRETSAIGGFPALRRDPRTGVPTWTPHRGLLAGATGVALVLLAAATDVEPTWDRLLLVDLPA